MKIRFKTKLEIPAKIKTIVDRLYLLKYIKIPLNNFHIPSNIYARHINTAIKAELLYADLIKFKIKKYENAETNNDAIIMKQEILIISLTIFFCSYY